VYKLWFSGSGGDFIICPAGTPLAIKVTLTESVQRKVRRIADFLRLPRELSKGLSAGYPVIRMLSLVIP
jgi:hypothetical protein